AARIHTSNCAFHHPFSRSISVQPRGSMWYTFLNREERGDHSDHHQPSGTNKKDTYRHTTGALLTLCVRLHYNNQYGLRQ
ncbi:hypothetical protein KUCAC02_012242, partial [Chaenocephalus aceratus]